MHAENKLTQKDIETLNNFMTNRIAGLLQTVFNGDITRAIKVLTFYASLSTDWATIKPDKEEFYM